MKTNLLFPPALIALAMIFAGCESTVQTTSGRRYLEKYPQPDKTGHSLGTSELDQRIAAVAAVEPTLHFPARIGLARIEEGRLSPLPREEGKSWTDLRDRLGRQFGEFVPLSLLVTEMVTPARTDSPSGWQHQENLLQETIGRIRLGAARQHLDAVLIYEVVYDREITGTSATILDFTGVGAFMGTRRSHGQGYATALLVDVRNGYPYGTATAVAQDSAHAALLGSGEKLRDQRAAVVASAVRALTPEVETMVQQLQAQLAANDALSLAATNQ